jgi:hypothetical protein
MRAYPARPLVGTNSCELPHFVYVISGRMRVVMEDGTEVELRKGAMPAGQNLPTPWAAQASAG